jgi:sulfur dioxygenase
MLFRQLFDPVSSTYTYLLASRPGGEALIIDPVLERVDRYVQLIDELRLKLVKAVDTHVHADHISALGALRDRTHCTTVMGERSNADVVAMRLADGERLTVEGLASRFSGACCACRRKHWSSPATTTRATPSRPSARSAPSTRASR